MILLSFLSKIMKITQFTPNQYNTELILKVEDAELATHLIIWVNDDFTDYSKSIDISSLLNGSSSQTINITFSDLSVNKLDGIYLIRLEAPGELTQALTGVYTRYKECILNKLSEIKLCDDCLDNISSSLITSQTLLTGLQFAVEQGFIEEAISIKKSLDKYCSNECKTCGNYTNITNNLYYDYDTN